MKFAVLVEITHIDKYYKKYGSFLCECGKLFTARLAHVEQDKIKSCGCYNDRIRRERSRTHTLTGHPILKSWEGMRQRCSNKNNAKYHRYGGRGINVCDRWNKVENFLEDMFETWFEGACIDRIDNDGDYGPDNCQWLSVSDSSRKGCR